MKNRLYINSMSLNTPLGQTFEENLDKILAADKSGMVERDDLVYGKTLKFGQVNRKILPEVPDGFLDIECNRIILQCINQIRVDLDFTIKKYGKDRVAVVIGSSNTGIHEGQKAIDEYLDNGEYPSWFSFDMLELGSPAKFVAEYLGVTGPRYTISTACSSSVKAFSSAQKLIDAGICDAVIVGGVDSLCTFASNGFYALEALSEKISNPFSKNRNGISIGEGGALFVVTPENIGLGIEVMGIGETSDAYHMTSPLPDGKTAQEAMQQALDEAEVFANEVGYVSLHGTGTALNDSMESRAVYNVFGRNTLCGSFKPLIGHTLGACGAIELALCCLLLDGGINRENKIPPHPWDGIRDEELSPINLTPEGCCKPLKYILSNAFAFGGSNASIVVGRR